ncbi:MAG: TetR/AcrR family transcriptional regulator C-terminal domain-containing protein [Ruminococcus sp.]
MARTAKTSEFLKECMADALIKLMETNPLKKISAEQIVSSAGVGRATWFRNFSSKSEALSYKLVREWERFAEKKSLEKRRLIIPENAYCFFCFISEIRKILSVIYQAENQSTVYEAFYEIISPEIGEMKEEKYAKQFYAYGLFGLVDEWIKCDYKESPEEMTAIFLKIRRIEG